MQRCDPLRVARGATGIADQKFTLPQFESLEGDDRLREEYRYDSTSRLRISAQPVPVPLYYVHPAQRARSITGSGTLVGFDYFARTTNTFISAAGSAVGVSLFGGTARPIYPEKPEVMSDVRWAAATNQYFATIITPIVPERTDRATQTSLRGVGVWAKRFDLSRDMAGRGPQRPAAGRAVCGRWRAGDARFTLGPVKASPARST